MQIHITGRHLRLTQAIRDYVEQKVGKAQRYFSHIIWAQVLLSVEKRSHQAEIVVHAPKQTFRSLAQAADLYAAVDLASDKVDHQLKKFKERLKERHKNAAPVPEVAAAAQEPLGRISVVKKVPVLPMTSVDAIEQLERTRYNFVLFQDKESKELRVVYRRPDDSFGLLQPVRRSGR